ncbi:putative Protein kinase domain [Paratrimastix pyriformis]|uniref:non-specific serine/threonine protein kinase n=1 Tax=Paratrimastix pyriformis TaxID=342808 RepID=A0ABQ8UJK8_9EUKA|nr:putative Protein kinase domain [Paratrimastix pyriformis]
MEYSGPGSGGVPFKRKTIVISACGPDTPSDALVEITTLRQPRREGRIPRFQLGDVPKADCARYIKEYLETQSDSDGPSAPSAPSAPPPPPSPSPATSQPAPPAGDHPRLFVLAGGRSTLDTVGYLKDGGKLKLIPVVGDPPLYRHLPGPSMQRKARPEDPDIIDPYHVLGAGAFGISFKLGDTRKGQEDVALKATAAPQTALERMMINNESYIPAAVRHPNVLPAAGPPMEVQLEPGGPVLRCLLTPFCEGGDLDKVIRRHLRSPSADPAADRTERWWLLVDMVRGLAYLHGKPFEHNDRRVLHNDIKPANVLLRPDRATGRLMALLADLGMACEYTGGSANYGMLLRGTPGFMAPELYAGTAEGQALLAASGMRPGNTPATDVYAMGVTLFCLYTQTDTAHKTEERPSEEELREAYAELGDLEAAAGGRPAVGLVGLLVRMCSENPTARPDMARVWGAVEAVAAVRNPPLAVFGTRVFLGSLDDCAVCPAGLRPWVCHWRDWRFWGIRVFLVPRVYWFWLAVVIELSGSRWGGGFGSDDAPRWLANAVEEAARRKAAEEEARRKAAEEEARRKAAEEEARRKAAEEEARRRAAEEEEAARRRAAEAELKLRCRGRAGFMVCLAAWLRTNRTVTKTGQDVVLSATSLTDREENDMACQLKLGESKMALGRPAWILGERVWHVFGGSCMVLARKLQAGKTPVD